MARTAATCASVPQGWTSADVDEAAAHHSLAIVRRSVSGQHTILLRSFVALSRVTSQAGSALGPEDEFILRADAAP